MEVTKLAMEDALLHQRDRTPIAESLVDGVYMLVTAGDSRVTIYKGCSAWRRRAARDAAAFGEHFDKREYIQQVDIEGAEIRLVLNALLKVVSVLDVLADI